VPSASGLSGARVAIVLPTAVGDAVHALAVVASLSAAAPGVRITWIIQPGPLGLVAGHPAVDEFVVFDRARGARGLAAVRAAVRGRRFDLVLALQPYFKAGLLTALLPAPRKVGYDRARSRDLAWLFATERLAPRPRGHVQDEYLEFVEHVGVPARLAWDVGPTLEERSRYAGLLPPAAGPTVAFVVGTSKPAKEWPAERYAAAVDRLAEARGARAVLVGGLGERESAVAAEVAARARRPVLDLRAWDLRRVAYLLDRADVLVSPDTGPMHLSVALGTPTVALMGYTNPKRFGPYRRFHDLMVDAYGDPGEDYPASAPHRPGRMERIGVDDVVEKVLRALDRYPRTSPSGHPSP
jgi:heptosyltransferase I